MRCRLFDLLLVITNNNPIRCRKTQKPSLNSEVEPPSGGDLIIRAGYQPSSPAPAALPVASSRSVHAKI